MDLLTTTQVGLYLYTGHLHTMAEAELEGFMSVEGVGGTLLQVSIDDMCHYEDILNEYEAESNAEVVAACGS